MRFGLVPIGSGEEIIRAMIGVAMLDGGAEGFGEWDGRVEMEAVDGSATARVYAAFHGSAVESVRERVRAESPSAEEIIL